MPPPTGVMFGARSHRDKPGKLVIHPRLCTGVPSIQAGRERLQITPRPDLPVTGPPGQRPQGRHPDTPHGHLRSASAPKQPLTGSPSVVLRAAGATGGTLQACRQASLAAGCAAQHRRGRAAGWTMQVAHQGPSETALARPGGCTGWRARVESIR